MSGFKTRISTTCERCGKNAYFNELHFQGGKVADTVSGVRLQYALRICEFVEDGEVACDRYEGEDAGLYGSFPLCDDCMEEIENWLLHGGELAPLEPLGEECE